MALLFISPTFFNLLNQLTTAIQDCPSSTQRTESKQAGRQSRTRSVKQASKQSTSKQTLRQWHARTTERLNIRPATLTQAATSQCRVFCRLGPMAQRNVDLNQLGIRMIAKEHANLAALISPPTSQQTIDLSFQEHDSKDVFHAGSQDESVGKEYTFNFDSDVGSDEPGLMAEPVGSHMVVDDADMSLEFPLHDWSDAGLRALLKDMHNRREQKQPHHEQQQQQQQPQEQPQQHQQPQQQPQQQQQQRQKKSQDQNRRPPLPAQSSKDNLEVQATSMPFHCHWLLSLSRWPSSWSSSSSPMSRHPMLIFLSLLSLLIVTCCSSSLLSLLSWSSSSILVSSLPLSSSTSLWPSPLSTPWLS